MKLNKSVVYINEDPMIDDANKKDLKELKAFMISIGRSDPAQRKDTENLHLKGQSLLCALTSLYVLGGTLCGNERHYFVKTKINGEEGIVDPMDLAREILDAQFIDGFDVYRHSVTHFANPDITEFIENTAPYARDLADMFITRFHNPMNKIKAAPNNLSSTPKMTA